LLFLYSLFLSLLLLELDEFLESDVPASVIACTIMLLLKHLSYTGLEGSTLNWEVGIIEYRCSYSFIVLLHLLDGWFDLRV
jgi:hypothetical protein